jgi:hypothetical protein
MNDAKQSLFDRFVIESETVRNFAAKLETRDDEKFYITLPAWFNVRTPVGNNPDWALVIRQLLMAQACSSSLADPANYVRRLQTGAHAAGANTSSD